MGVGRHAKDSNPGFGFCPKLIVTGRLEGTLFGRPVEIIATGNQILVKLANLRSAWRLRRFVSPGLTTLLFAFRHAGLCMRLQIQGKTSFEVLPKPNFVIRLLTPSLR